MNNIQKTDSLPANVIGKFSKPSALQEAESNLIDAIDKALLTCYFELNQIVPNEIDRTVLVNKILDSILEKYTSIRVEEISIAFSRGIRKEYGEYYGLCLISFEQFIEGYLHSPERREQAQKYYKQIEQSTEPTADEKFNTAKKLAIEAFGLVQSCKPLGLTAATVYVFLNGLGLIDADYKKGIMKPAMETLLAEKEKDISFCDSLMGRRHLQQNLDMLKQNIEADSITHSQHEEIKRVAKRIALTNYFQDLIAVETDLEELIESKRLNPNT